MAGSNSVGCNSAEVVIISSSDEAAKKPEMEVFMGKPALTTIEEQDYVAAMEIINAGCDLAWLKWKHCQAYLKKHGIRLTDKKAVLVDRIQEHLELKRSGGQAKYPVSTFVFECQGNVCIGDTVLFKQQLYEEKFDEFLRRRCPPLGTRTIAGRVINDIYGILKQQRTITIEVLWSNGVMPLPPLQSLRFRGHDFCSIKILRQPWTDEDKRKKILQERHAMESLPAGNLAMKQVERGRQGHLPRRLDMDVPGKQVQSQDALEDCRDVHAVGEGLRCCGQQEVQMPAEIASTTTYRCSFDEELTGNTACRLDDKEGTQPDVSTERRKIGRDFMQSDDALLQSSYDSIHFTAARDGRCSSAKSSIGCASELDVPIDLPMQVSSIKCLGDQRLAAVGHLVDTTGSCRDFVRSNDLSYIGGNARFNTPVCVASNNSENCETDMDQDKYKDAIPERSLNEGFSDASEPHGTLRRTTHSLSESRDPHQFKSTVFPTATGSQLSQAHFDPLIPESGAAGEISLSVMSLEQSDSFKYTKNSNCVFISDKKNILDKAKDSQQLASSVIDKLGYGPVFSGAVKNFSSDLTIQQDNFVEKTARHHLPTTMDSRQNVEEKSNHTAVEVVDLCKFEPLIPKETAKLQVPSKEPDASAAIRLDGYSQGGKELPIIIPEREQWKYGTNSPHFGTPEIKSPKYNMRKRTLNSSTSLQLETAKEREYLPLDHPDCRPVSAELAGGSGHQVPANANNNGSGKTKRKKFKGWATSQSKHQKIEVPANANNNGSGKTKRKKCKGWATSQSKHQKIEGHEYSRLPFVNRSLSDIITHEGDLPNATAQQRRKTSCGAEANPEHPIAVSTDQQTLQKVKHSLDKGTNKRKCMGTKGSMPESVQWQVKKKTGHLQLTQRKNVKRTPGHDTEMVPVLGPPHSTSGVVDKICMQKNSFEQKDQQQKHKKTGKVGITRKIQDNEASSEHHVAVSTDQQTFHKVKHSADKGTNKRKCTGTKGSMPETGLWQVKKSTTHSQLTKRKNVKRTLGQDAEMVPVLGPLHSISGVVDKICMQKNSIEQKDQQQKQKKTGVLQDPSFIQSGKGPANLNLRKDKKKPNFTGVIMKNETCISIVTKEGEQNVLQSTCTGAVFCQRSGCLNLRPKNCVNKSCRKCCKKMGGNCSKHKSIMIVK